MRVSITLLLAAFVVAGCSSTTSGQGTTRKPTLPGTYHFVRDVGRSVVKKGATLTLVLRTNGTLSFDAVQPGQHVTDQGTWSVSGDKITLHSKDQVIEGTGTYGFDGATLQLPVFVVDDGTGQSEWTRVGGPPPTSPSGSSPASPGSSTAPTSGPSTPPAAQQAVWSDDVWDTSSDASAAGTKAYSQAIDSGASRADAIQAALTAAKAVPDVQSATLSSNGLNIGITYTDGQTEDIVTERLQQSDATGGSNFVGSHFAGSSAPPSGCATLPGQSADPREPGREGVNPGGGYGVQIYDQKIQPRPVTHADTPPVKRALLISPQYDVSHPLHKNEYTTIRGVTGDNIECITASLQKVGYKVDTILGVKNGSTRTNTGELAIQAMIKDLTSNKYGVVYFIGHGYLTPEGDQFAGMWFGSVNLNIPGVQAILKGGKVTRDNVDAVKAAYATYLGLTWDPNNQVIGMAPDDDGTASIVVKPALFTQLRAKSLDLSKSLVFIDACSSAVTLNMAQATGAKAYVGWKHEMDGGFLSQASEAIFDVMTDTAHPLQFAAQVWQIHEKWKAPSGRLDPEEDWINLAALGEDQKPYPVLDAQTYILIFAIRNGPSSATAKIATNATFVQNCYDQIWKFHKGALASPACHALDYGGTQPTEAEVQDALSIVGAKPIKGLGGRWTLAD